MTTKPDVTVAVVCLNEEENIADCLNSLLNQSCGSRNYEILVVDNNSTDDTQKIIKQFQRRFKRIRMVVNPKRGIATSRNVALRQARGELLAFTDADCLAPRDWLFRLVRGYRKRHHQNARVVGVGGANFPPSTSSFYLALGMMLNTFLGSRGSVQARRYSEDRPVPHLSCANVLYEKKEVEAIGGFDESFGSIIEDEDLTFRLSQEGHQFVYLAKTGVIHKMPINFSSWAKKMFTYGKGRMWFLRKHPQGLHPHFLMPILLILTFPISLPFYLPAIFFYSFGVAWKNKRLDLLVQIYGLYLVTHLAYGVGEIYGLFKNRPKPR